MSVVVRVEPGCLGPEGESHISGFCDFAQPEFRSLNSDYIAWVVEPRHDKTLPEMQYILAKKIINRSQVERYLAVFEKALDEFESNLGDKLETLIDVYMGRQAGGE